MVNITKTFPGVRALDDVTFACARGEVHALCGENGAGKSTLIKILGGAYRPDGGRILLGGREVAFSHPVASRAAGISVIHQELSLLPHRTVAENIFLGIEPTRYGVLDRTRMRGDATRLLARLGASIPPETGANAAYCLPGELAVRCRRLAASLGLDLAGIDLRCTPEGEWYCFEVNPSPGFTYYQDATGQPIAEAIAQYLS